MQAFLGDNKEGFYMGKVQDSVRDPRNFGILFKKSCRPANPHSDRSHAEQKGVEKGS